jgi:hypothetical protein
MRPPNRATSRAFTLVVCSLCPSGAHETVLDELRTAIRHCPHGMLVSAGCLLGAMTCTVHPAAGAMVVLQPCAHDRTPSGPASLVGPVCSRDDAALLRRWVEAGDWNIQTLPARLRGRSEQLQRLSRRN